MAQCKNDNNKKSRILPLRCGCCGKFICVPQYKLNKNSKNYFCDKICYGVFQRKRKIINCEICHKEREIPLSIYKQGARCCSRKCHHIYQSIRPQIYGEENHAYINGRTHTAKGYILILKSDHPNKNTNGYVYEHRLVMEKYLGRYLTKKEVVHHKDENPSNNKISNLKLFKHKNEHLLYHLKLNKRKAK